MSGVLNKEPLEEDISEEDEEEEIDPAILQRVREKASAAKFAIEQFYENSFRHKAQRDDR